MPKSKQLGFKLLRVSIRSYVVYSFLFLSACSSYAEHEGPWTRHTVDNSSRGADGVRLADANGDGLMDIVTGWEEGGIVRLYLNPGPEKAKEKWPAVTVGPAKNVEDAVMVDLDNDGAIDVVSSCEGKTKTMFVHWGPKDKTKLLDPDAWETEAIPATVGKQQWMYCLPLVDHEKGTFNLLVGSKGENGALGSIFRSRQNPRDLHQWRYFKYFDAGWIMSLEMAGGSNKGRIIITDRKGTERGVYEMSFPGGWDVKQIEKGKAEYMFAAMHPTPFVDDGAISVVATRNGFIRLFKKQDPPKQYADHTTVDIPNPFGIRNGKAVAIGRVSDDFIEDLVVSFNTQGQKDKPGVAWIQVLPEKDPKDWPAYDISGLEGKKFDRLELIDLDGDGDLDVLTCEEADNLGVIWYENPYGKAKDQ